MNHLDPILLTGAIFLIARGHWLGWERHGYRTYSRAFVLHFVGAAALLTLRGL